MNVKNGEDLKKAIMKAADGDSIVLSSGDKFRGFTLSGVKKKIALVGSGNRVDGEIKFSDCGEVSLYNLFLPNPSPYGVMIVNCAGFLAKGLNVQGAQRSGILTANTPNVVLDGNICTGSKEQHGIYCSQSGDNLVLTKNTCSDNAFSGIQVNAVQDDANPRAPHNADSISENVLIQNNILKGNQIKGKAGALQLSGVHNGKVYGNVFKGHKGRVCLTLWDDGTNKPELASKNIEIDANDFEFALGIPVVGYISVGKNCTYLLGQKNVFRNPGTKPVVSA